jgi:hypothetical protein
MAFRPSFTIKETMGFIAIKNNNNINPVIKESFFLTHIFDVEIMGSRISDFKKKCSESKSHMEVPFYEITHRINMLFLHFSAKYVMVYL